MNSPDKKKMKKKKIAKNISLSVWLGVLLRLF